MSAAKKLIAAVLLVSALTASAANAHLAPHISSATGDRVIHILQRTYTRISHVERAGIRKRLHAWEVRETSCLTTFLANVKADSAAGQLTSLNVWALETGAALGTLLQGSLVATKPITADVNRSTLAVAALPVPVRLRKDLKAYVRAVNHLVTGSLCKSLQRSLNDYVNQLAQPKAKSSLTTLDSSITWSELTKKLHTNSAQTTSIQALQAKITKEWALKFKPFKKSFAAWYKHVKAAGLS